MATIVGDVTGLQHRHHPQNISHLVETIKGFPLKAKPFRNTATDQNRGRSRVASHPPFRTAHQKNIMRGNTNGNTWVPKTFWSQPASQMQLPSIKLWFARKKRHWTLDEWRRLHFWPTRLSKVFLLSSMSCTLGRFKSLQCYSLQIVLPKSPCSGTNVEQLEIN